MFEIGDRVMIKDNVTGDETEYKCMMGIVTGADLDSGRDNDLRLFDVKFNNVTDFPFYCHELSRVIPNNKLNRTIYPNGIEYKKWLVIDEWNKGKRLIFL